MLASERPESGATRPLRKNTYIVQKLEAGGDLATTGSYEEPSVAAGPSKDRESNIQKMGTKQVWPQTQSDTTKF